MNAKYCLILCFLALVLMGVKKISENDLLLGDGTSTDKSFTANVGSGASNPRVKFDASTSSWQFSNNGIDFAPLGTGGGGLGVNFISNPDFELNADDYLTFDDGAVTTPVDGEGGSTAAISFAVTQVESEILRGDGSGKMEKSAINGQGEGIAIDFSIERADANKRLSIEMVYSTSANFALGDLGVFVLCDLNGTPGFISVLAATDGTDDNLVASTAGFKAEFLGSFISPADEDKLDCRLIFMIKTTSALAWDFILDDLVVGPGLIATSTVITPWASFTPTSNLTGCTSEIGFDRQVGDSWEAQIFLAGCDWDSTGAIDIDIRSGLTIDFTKVTSTLNQAFGDALALDSSATGFNSGFIFPQTGNTFAIGGDTGGGGVWTGSGSLPFDWLNNADVLSIHVEPIPVEEFAGTGVVNLLTQDNLSEWSFQTNTPTNLSTNVEFQEQSTRRVGDSLEVRGALEFSGANTEGIITVNLPTGLTADANKLGFSFVATSRDEIKIGAWKFHDEADDGTHGIIAYNQDTDAIQFLTPDTLNIFVNTATNNPITIADDVLLSWEFEIPIAEFSGPQNSLVGFAIATENIAGLLSITAQNIAGDKTFVDGLGIITPPRTDVDIDGSFATLGTQTLTAMTITSLDVTGKSLFVIDSSSNTVTINSLSGGVKGQRITFLKANATSNDVTIAHEGTGDQPIVNRSSLDVVWDNLELTGAELVFSDFSGRWIMLGNW